MIKIEEGGTYDAARVRSGSSERGEWELIGVKASGKARQQMTLFPTNIPTGIQEGEQFIVKRISSVVLKAAKDNDGNWTRQDVNVNCEVERIPGVELDGDDPFGGLDDVL